MTPKTLLKLTNLDQYTKLKTSNTLYFVATEAVGPIDWHDALKYKPLSYNETQQLRKGLIDDAKKSITWLSTEFNKIMAKTFCSYMDIIDIKHKADKGWVRPVYRFPLTKSSQYGIL